MRGQSGELKRELEQLFLAMTKRFSARDQADIRGGEFKAAARRHGIKEPQMGEFAQVLRQVTDTQQETAAYSQALSRAEAVKLARR